jgi:crossover junction endodeoxyribonuclease RusA
VKATLPFPPKELNPNKRHDRRAIAGIRAMYRDTCFYLTKQACKSWTPIEGPVALRVTFVQPDERHRDVDNMLSASKSAIDGFAQALGMNDRQFNPLHVGWTRAKGAGAVILEIVEAP